MYSNQLCFLFMISEICLHVYEDLSYIQIILKKSKFPFFMCTSIHLFSTFHFTLLQQSLPFA